MASKGFSKGANKLLDNGTKYTSLCNGYTYPIPYATRSMATVSPSVVEPTNLSIAPPSSDPQQVASLPISTSPTPFRQPRNPFISSVPVTLHSFPSMEPVSFTTYPSTHLLVPLRRDILHRAVIFEGDNTRQGTASTKWRSEVHGSGRKIRPQKGSGSARLGDKKSPMLRGGGVAFGPKPRDFGTDLPRKIYDLAWRTALSYRYRRGELLVTDDLLKIPVRRLPPATNLKRWTKELLEGNGLGNGHGRSLFIGLKKNKNYTFFSMLKDEDIGRHGRGLGVDDVDVKDLLEGGRVVVERRALDLMLEAHQSDLGPGMRFESEEIAEILDDIEDPEGAV
ncbi:54S ribosomal protein yml6, mitochondrial [Elasticomyces elasticus]|nr:54S ribosomal protein yml6, mitochondrial [Elasticomyces elasticus]